ncbi:MAG TPA: class I SAM-dependent methyltransferase [Tepidisphaeraceae bacterium]|jgi:trans-aconitate methyltransferase|nr:class I SAM-dependent methyltransferase [Tepidisphaeraceae bacterium]
MNPTEVGQSYDAITDRWSSPAHPLTGVAAHDRAVRFVKGRGAALDAGCGCNGRLIDYLLSQGFSVEGVDVSERMVALARQRNPAATIYHADICRWSLPRTYDLISGWDSIWHVPLAEQAALLEKLCAGLNPGGVLIFTLGGTDAPGEVHDAHMGVPMYTATLGIPQTLDLLARCGCVCRHLEYDQFPELHVYVIAQKA